MGSDPRGRICRIDVSVERSDEGDVVSVQAFQETPEGSIPDAQAQLNGPAQIVDFEVCQPLVSQSQESRVKILMFAEPRLHAVNVRAGSERREFSRILQEVR